MNGLRYAVVTSSREPWLFCGSGSGFEITLEGLLGNTPCRYQLKISRRSNRPQTNREDRVSGTTRWRDLTGDLAAMDQTKEEDKSVSS